MGETREDILQRIRWCFFFFQAEDGIRDIGVTGVQTCALPISTTVILNFILLWNEFLYAVVLINDEANRTLPLGIQRFMGDQLEDVGMIATGLMIAIVPVILVYAFFSERLIQGMTAGAVK